MKELKQRIEEMLVALEITKTLTDEHYIDVHKNIKSYIDEFDKDVKEKDLEDLKLQQEKLEILLNSFRNLNKANVDFSEDVTYNLRWLHRQIDLRSDYQKGIQELVEKTYNQVKEEENGHGGFFESF